MALAALYIFLRQVCQGTAELSGRFDPEKVCDRLNVLRVATAGNDFARGLSRRHKGPQSGSWMREGAPSRDLRFSQDVNVIYKLKSAV